MLNLKNKNMNTPKSQKLEIVIPAYRMHSQNFINVLDGISEENALKRIDNNTNHVVWMAGNFVNMRYSTAWVLGLKEEDPYSDLFFQGKAWSPDFKYPSLEELKKSFHHISPMLFNKLLEVSDEELAEIFEIGMKVPFVKEDKLNFVGMCIGREDYLCGQIGLMRKLLGLKGMSYDIDENMNY